MKHIIQILLFVTFSFNHLNADSFLMPDEAFKPYAKVNKKMQVEAGVNIADGIYLYENKFSVKIKDDAFSIRKLDKPQAVEHHDSQVFLTSVNFVLTLKNDKKLTGMQKITVVISYQGCSDKGLCYNPLTKEFALTIDTAKLGQKTVATLATVSKDDVSETDAIVNTIKSGSLVGVLLTFLGFGLLLALTPCVFPMIPIISGVIVSQGKGLTTRKAFMLSVVYVLSMAVAYTIAGVLAGLFGSNLQAALQTPWVIYSFSSIFVVLAFSMFGFYELKLPDVFVSKISAKGQGGGYVGVAIMGFLSALIVGPCVAAPLAGALVYIGQTGDAVLGGLALFSMSIGMGLPLIVVGVSAGKFMPKPGAWMTMVTTIFGVMMLGVAIWMLEKVVDSSITTLLYGVLGIGFSIHLGLFEVQQHLFKKSIAVFMFIYSLSITLGFLAGSASLTKPLGFLNNQSAANVVQAKTEKLHFNIVTSIVELDKLLEANKGKKVLLDFAADWCTSCKEFSEITFVDPVVIAKMNEFVLIRADVTKNGVDEKALSKKYGVFGPPAIIFFDEKHKVRKSKTVVGYMEPKPFIAHLNSL